MYFELKYSQVYEFPILKSIPQYLEEMRLPIA